MMRGSDTDAVSVGDYIPNYVENFINPPKTEEELSDDFDRWYISQQKAGVVH